MVELCPIGKLFFIGSMVRNEFRYSLVLPSINDEVSDFSSPNPPRSRLKSSKELVENLARSAELPGTSMYVKAPSLDRTYVRTFEKII